MIVAAFNAALAPASVTAHQFTVLTALAYGSPMSVAALAEAVGMHSSTTPRKIAPLVRRGLVRIRQGEDRRQRLIALTAKGIRSGSVAKVASVGLPAMEKGVVPNRPVVSVASQIQVQMIPRPAVKAENCGDDKVFVACPTLKIRYDTPYTSEDHQ